MTKKITKVDETHVAVVETVEKESIHTEKQLVDEKTRLLERISDIDEMLAVLK